MRWACSARSGGLEASCGGRGVAFGTLFEGGDVELCVLLLGYVVDSLLWC